MQDPNKSCRTTYTYSAPIVLKVNKEDCLTIQKQIANSCHFELVSAHYQVLLTDYRYLNDIVCRFYIDAEGVFHYHITNGERKRWLAFQEIKKVFIPTSVSTEVTTDISNSIPSVRQIFTGSMGKSALGFRQNQL